MICAAIVYAFVSLVIGFAWELEACDPWESTPVRVFRAVSYAVAWPLLAGIALWFFLSLDDEDPFL